MPGDGGGERWGDKVEVGGNRVPNSRGDTEQDELVGLLYLQRGGGMTTG